MKPNVLVALAVIWSLGCSGSSGNPSGDKALRIDPESGDETVVAFADPLVEATIRKLVNLPSGPLTIDAVASIVELDLSVQSRRPKSTPTLPSRRIAIEDLPKVTDLGGLEFCTGLQDLNLEGNAVSDLTPLSALSNLEELRLSRNEITSVSSLETLSKITNLDLGQNKIANISPLAGIHELKHLSLEKNNLSSVAALADLEELESLQLSHNMISNISPLVKLTKLSNLELGKNTVSDISVLAEHKSLLFLGLEDNAISDITPLAGHTELLVLSMNNNPLTIANVDATIGLMEDRDSELRFSFESIKGEIEIQKRVHEPVQLSGTLETFTGTASSRSGKWPRFRGEGFDNIAVATPRLADAWGDDGPEILWSQAMLGDGYAAPAVFDGVVYIMDYDGESQSELIRALSLDDGREIWRRSYVNRIRRNHGMSRTIPAVTEDYIVAIGARCHVVCLDRATGEYRWGINLQADYGTDQPTWYAGQCPIIDKGLAIIAPAGDEVLMMAVDCETGEIAWETPNSGDWEMSHSSIMPMTLLGKKTYVYFAIGGVVGVAAEGDDVGAILWEVPTGINLVMPSPVQIGGDRIFVTTGYDAGSMMLKVFEANRGYIAEIVSTHPVGEGLSSEIQTPIYSDGLLYAVMPKKAGDLSRQFVCFRPDGTLVWSSGKSNRYGLGPFLKADEKFYLLDDDGVLTMLDAAKSEYVQLGRANLFVEGHDAWGPIALAGSRMLLRDMNNLVCIELGVE